MPEIDPAVRKAVRALPVADAHAALAKEDPEAAARLRPSDTTRIARALEVVRCHRPAAQGLAGGEGRRHRRAVALAPARAAAAARLAPRTLRCAVRKNLFRRRDCRGQFASGAKIAGACPGDARDRRARDRRLPARRADAASRRSQPAEPPPANMPSANIPGSAASRRPTGRASKRRSIAPPCPMP